MLFYVTFSLSKPSATGSTLLTSGGSELVEEDTKLTSDKFLNGIL